MRSNDEGMRMPDHYKWTGVGLQLKHNGNHGGDTSSYHDVWAVRSLQFGLLSAGTSLRGYDVAE